MPLRLWVTQYSDGVVTSDREVPSVVPGEGPLETLQRKAQSASEKGWTVTWTNAEAFTAVKQYPGKIPSEKRREFRLEEQ